MIIAAGARVGHLDQQVQLGKPAWAYYAIVAVAVVALIILVLVPFVRWRTEHFVITNHHVFFRTGLLSRREHQIPLGQIANMETEVTFWGRLMGYGSLIVESSADQPLKFRNVASLSKVQAQLNQLIRDERERTHRGPDRGVRRRTPAAQPGYQSRRATSRVTRSSTWRPNRITGSRVTRRRATRSRATRSRAIPHRGRRRRVISPPRPTSSRPATRRPDTRHRVRINPLVPIRQLRRRPSSRARPDRPRPDRPRPRGRPPQQS